MIEISKHLHRHRRVVYKQTTATMTARTAPKLRLSLATPLSAAVVASAGAAVVLSATTGGGAFVTSGTGFGASVAFGASVLGPADEEEVEEEEKGNVYEVD